jgi:hypothetical protein
LRHASGLLPPAFSLDPGGLSSAERGHLDVTRAAVSLLEASQSARLLLGEIGGRRSAIPALTPSARSARVRRFGVDRGGRCEPERHRSPRRQGRRLNDWELERGKKDWNVPVRGRMVTNDGLACATLAKRDLGLACVPEPNIREDLESGRLEAVLEGFAPTVCAPRTSVDRNRDSSHCANMKTGRMAMRRSST